MRRRGGGHKRRYRRVDFKRNNIGVPGTVAGLLYALEQFGTLDRETVLAPAIRAAQEGYLADADYVSAARGVAAQFERNPEYKERFSFVWRSFLYGGAIQVGEAPGGGAEFVFSLPREKS